MSDSLRKLAEAVSETDRHEAFQDASQRRFFELLQRVSQAEPVAGREARD